MIWSKHKTYLQFLNEKISKTLELNNFLQYAFDLYNDFTSENENLTSFHTCKENNVIVQFLRTLISFNGVINDCTQLTNDQKSSLKDVHYTLTSQFNFSSMIQSEISTQVNDALRTNMDRSNTTNNVSSNAEFRIENESDYRRIQRIIENKSNQKDFSFLRNKTNKYLRYNNHAMIAKLHLNNKTTPKSLFFSNYPEPMIKHDEDYSIFFYLLYYFYRLYHFH